LMISQTRGEVVVVADHTKMGTVADFAIAGLDEVDRLVVDDGLEEEYRKRLVEAGVSVTLAGEPEAEAPDDG
jgi:DeoR/GlpR family transcriptional regulator of sugar metabolism